MKEELQVLTVLGLQGGGCGKWQVNRVLNFHTRHLSSTPESCLWLDLGKKSTLVKVREWIWFWSKVNKQISSSVTITFFSYKARPQFFPNLNCFECPKITFKKCDNAVVTKLDLVAIILPPKDICSCIETSFLGNMVVWQLLHRLPGKCHAV